MNCSPHDLKDYFFGELARDQRDSVERHVQACSTCRDELEELRLTQATLLTLRDEEPPRRIAFISDKIFEPNWWQRFWQSGPRLGFASAALLSAAILVHGFTAMPKPAIIARPVAMSAPGPAALEIRNMIDAAVAKAVAGTEGRQKVALEQALARQQHGFDLQHKATLAVVASQLEYYEKIRNVSLHAENEMPRGVAQQ